MTVRLRAFSIALAMLIVCFMTGDVFSVTEDGYWSKSALSCGYRDLGGALAVTYEPVGEKGVCTITCKSGKSVKKITPKTDGFGYISGLKAGKKYTVTVFRKNDTVNESSSFEAQLSSTDFSPVSAVKTGFEYINIGWRDFAPGMTYTVYRLSGNKWKEIGHTTKNSFTDKGLKAGKAYKYKLGVRSGNRTERINETVFTVSTLSPPDFSPVITYLGGAAAISYNDEGRGCIYSVSCSSGKKKFDVTPVGRGFVYLDNLTTGKKYKVSISCTDGTKKYTRVFTVSGREKSGKVISAEGAGCSFIRLKWVDLAKGQTYLVYREQNGKWVKVGETKECGFTDVNLANGRQYRYRLAVKGINGIVPIKGTSIRASTMAPADLKPVYTDLGGAAAVNYNDGGKKFSYYITYSTPEGKTYSVSPRARGFVYLPKLEKGIYTVRVTGTDGTDKFTSAFTIAISGDKKDILTASSISSGHISLRWTDFARGQTYSVYRVKNGKWVKIGETNYNSYTDSGLESGTEHRYKISVKTPAGDVEIKGTAANFRTLPENPLMLSAVRSGNTVKLSWQQNPAAEKYTVYRSESYTGDYRPVSDVKGTEYVLDNVTGNSTDFFRVTYSAGGHESDPSAACEAYIPRTKTAKTLLAGTSLMNSASWDSGVKCAARRGSTVTVTGESGSFYRCIAGDKTGYIYKRAIDGGSAPDPADVTLDNLDRYLDDIIFTIGGNPHAVWEYVNNYKYNAARIDPRIVNCSSLLLYRNELAVNMIKNGSGLCYHYAALSAKLLARCGCPVQLVYCPHGKNGFHCYNLVQYGGEKRIFDACRHTSDNELGYFPDRVEFITVRDLDIRHEQCSNYIK